MNNAKELFTAIPRKHNCAQAVACGCGQEGLYEELASCGGGKAPDGVCGALHAALGLVAEHCREELAREFAGKLGSADCVELKANFGAPCAACVETGAALVEYYGKK